MKSDRAKTLAQQYLDPKSFMRSDGSEVLKGEDWVARKRELWERCGGQCEHMGDYFDIGTEKFEKLRCPMQADDPHHVIRRSVKRDDRLSNLLALCRWHHESKDSRKPRWSRGETMRQAKGGS